MPHHVYANGNEICAKSADGTSVMAADVCFSPGAPLPGVPILYMNMCKAPDIANGSRTVFIKGKEICLEDKSYFATSYGDEPATQAMKKGTVSGAVQGKCYFVSWSPDVFVEGLAVTRHMDMVTHNHSNPANTPPVYYMSRASPPGACKKDVERMEKRCKPDEDKNKKRKGIPADRQGGNHGSWVLDHCGPLFVKPGVDFESWLKDFGDLDSVISQATSALQSEVIAKLEKEIAEFAVKKAVAFAARRGLTGWIPVVGWVITAVDVVSTGVELAEKLPQMRQELAELKNMAGSLNEAASKITGIFDKFKDKIKNFDKLSPEEQKKVAGEVMADVQSAYAAASPCLRARKCLLVPYKETDSQADTWAGKGCCPGQTGHHLLPDAMFRNPEKTAAYREAWNKDPATKGKTIPRDNLPKEDCWQGYSEKGAPTICMEGANNTQGSHGLFHKYTELKIKPHLNGRTMSYKTARDLMVNEVARLYGCNPDCLKEQLDAYYKGAHNCGPLEGAKVVPHSGMAGGGPSVEHDGM
ncbi:PAAR-like domain-containing protein [Sorangium sp. So ce1389]|uniref:PAAR-like domain-containing protein n=1 Tax=Sorangium sp. So ce1389 TaxID=3133336 RepID=UPI003F62BB7C